MPSIIDRIAQTSAVLRVPTGEYHDGKPLYEDVDCRVFSLGGVRNGAPQNGQIVDTRKFLIASDVEIAPDLPCKLVIDGAEYSMMSATPYVNMQGVLQGYRVEVTGG